MSLSQRARALANRPTFWIAAVLVKVAAAGLWAWFQFKGGLRSWTPNVVVGALTAALTITVVDWAVRRESKQKLQPRVDDALYWIGWSFRGLVSAVAIDYAGTHLGSFKQLPDDAPQLFRLWLDERGCEDSSRPEALSESLVLEGGIEVSQAVQRARERDREVLGLDLIREIDEFTRAVNFATWRAGARLACRPTMHRSQRKTWQLELSSLRSDLPKSSGSMPRCGWRSRW